MALARQGARQRRLQSSAESSLSAGWACSASLIFGRLTLSQDVRPLELMEEEGTQENADEKSTEGGVGGHPGECTREEQGAVSALGVGTAVPCL